MARDAVDFDRNGMSGTPKRGSTQHLKFRHVGTAAPPGANEAGCELGRRFARSHKTASVRNDVEPVPHRFKLHPIGTRPIKRYYEDPHATTEFKHLSARSKTRNDEAVRQLHLTEAQIRPSCREVASSKLGTRFDQCYANVSTGLRGALQPPGNDFLRHHK